MGMNLAHPRLLEPMVVAEGANVRIRARVHRLAMNVVDLVSLSGERVIQAPGATAKITALLVFS